jgi:hypothetical protein
VSASRRQREYVVSIACIDAISMRESRVIAAREARVIAARESSSDEAADAMRERRESRVSHR